MRFTPERTRPTVPCAGLVLRWLLLLAAAPTAVAQTAPAPETVAAFRFLSSVIRDRLPSADEARQFYSSPSPDQALTTLVTAWLASDDHRRRIERHFNDMFGSSPFLFLADDEFNLIPYDPAAHALAPPDLATPGVYYLSSAVKPACGGAPVSASAWWSDTPIQICPSAVSDALQYPGGITCTDAGATTGLRNAACGCGPEQLICYPADLKSHVVAGVAREFEDRGLAAYQGGWSWAKLLGGETFYGDRWLYHHYLYQQKLVVSAALPSPAELALLKALPLVGKVEAVLPAAVPARAGVVTMPAFLRRFNNFRSRVRALSNQLLCKDVDGSLNSDGYSAYLNPDMTAFDRAHGGKAACASCHFGMDNQGSTLLGWDANGFYEAWAPPAQTGHVFGLDGEGPDFLIQGYVQRGAGFAGCMAKTTWQAFTGAPWAGLTAAEQAELTTQAAIGPQQAIRWVLTSAAIRRLRGAAAPAPAPGKVYDFAADIAPILARSCAGAACHSPGNNRSASSAYVGSQALFQAAPKERLASGSMPPAGSGSVLTDQERAALVAYLGAAAP